METEERRHLEDQLAREAEIRVTRFMAAVLASLGGRIVIPAAVARRAQQGDLSVACVQDGGTGDLTYYLVTRPDPAGGAQA